ncbi:MAG: aminomethyl-transferring glycine dehydrogenase subunit GcvPB, partial [Alphaproteobacteria bacterium]|nr:aminomethyl-transferring glycine dehydrogenase subunit GcvPB [Alphaproteobacteria bacterium]
MSDTISGNHGLLIEEPLIFEQSSEGMTGVDFAKSEKSVNNKLGGLKREGKIGLSGLSEPQVMRHYTKLSQKNYSIDTGFYPLGSCT